MKRLLTAALMAAALSGVTALSAATNTNTSGMTGAMPTGFTAGQTFTHLRNRDVKSHSGEELGKLSDVVVDLESGRVLYATVSTGTSQNFAVPGTLFAKPTGNNPLVLNTDKQHLTTAPRTPAAADASLSSRDFVTKVYQHYDQQPWWSNWGTPTGRDTNADSGTFGNAQKASRLLGMTVEDQSKQTLGTVKDLVIDMKDGRAPFVLLNAPNIAKPGDVIPVPPMTLTQNADKNHLATGMDKTKLQSAPQVQYGTMTQINDPTFAANVYQYYGKQNYWQAKP